MANIIDTILDIQNRSTYLDALKSENMLNAQNLMMVFFDIEEEITFASEEEIVNLSKQLIDSKESLIICLNEFIEYIESLDCALWEVIK